MHAVNDAVARPRATELDGVLAAGVHTACGDRAQLTHWEACALSDRPGCRVVHYQVGVQPAEAAAPQCWQCVGKFYGRHETALKVVAALRMLEASHFTPRCGVAFPGVIIYHAPWGLLLLTYQPGVPVLNVLDTAYQPILTAIGQGLAALHTTPGPLDRLAPPTAIVAELRQRVQHLCTWMPAAASALGHIVAFLARHAPPAIDRPTLVHGDFGPAQLLWDDGRLAMLDFDRCGLGDPALDLGTLLAQLRRRALMRVGTTRDLAELRTLVLDAYHRNVAQSSGFAERVAWYERVVLLRKVHFLAGQEDGEKRAQAMALLRLLAGLTEAYQPDC